MKRVVNYRPAALFALCLAAGIAAAGLCLESYLARTVLLAVVAVGTAVLFVLRKGKFSAYIAAFTLGLLLLSGSCDLYNSKIVSATDATVTARVVSGAAASRYGFGYTVDDLTVNGSEVKGKAYFYCADSDVEAGSVLKFNADVQTTQFSDDWLFMQQYSKGIYYRLYGGEYEVTGVGGVPLEARIKRAVSRNIYSVLRADTADIIMALVFSEKSDVDEELYEDVGATGLAHLFAVSGLHIGFLAAAIIWLLKKCKASAVVRLVVTPSVLLVYALLCGFPASVLRAAVMTTVYLVADVIGTKKDSLSTLGVSAVLCLIVRPVELYLAGFQMSFMAVLGLILFVQHGKPWFKHLPKTVGSIVQTSIATNIMLLPVIARVYGAISILFIPANILILPIMPFIFVFLLLNVAITTILPFLAPLNYLSGIAVFPIKLLAFLTGSLTVNTLPVADMGWFAIAFYAILIVCSRFVFLKRQTKAAICIAVLAVSLPFLVLI